MTLDIMEKFEVVDTSTLSYTTGGGYGAQCAIGTLGSVILGVSFFGPWGAPAGLVGGNLAFCYHTVS